jgi:hypothetical protein
MIVKIVTVYEPDPDGWIEMRIRRRGQETQMPEKLVDAKVTYTVEYDGQVYIVEHVPAKISQETGEQYFAPETVERIRVLIKSRRKPDKVIQTPVYEYA